MESVLHLFFEFAVAAQLWCVLCEILKVHLGGSFESNGQFWLFGHYGSYEMTFVFRTLAGKGWISC